MTGQGTNLFCNCICTWQPVRVVHGDGHIRSSTRLVTVRELLKHHPHHFVCEPTSDGPVYHSGMLPLDMELVEGRMYRLLPLPRLLPHLPSTFPNPPSCPCFSQRDNVPGSSSDSAGHDRVGKAVNEEDSRVKNWYLGNQGQIILVAAKKMQKFRHRIYKSKLMESLVFTSRRMLPERLLNRLSFQKLDNNLSKGSIVGKSEQYSCSRNRWRPDLECISEVHLLNSVTV